MQLKKDKLQELFLDHNNYNKIVKIMMNCKMGDGASIIQLIFLAILILRDTTNKIDSI